MDRSCRICGAIARGAKKHIGTEMMYGTREQFAYFECCECGCLQIEDIPEDLSRFYPPGYYSGDVESQIKILLKSRRLKHDLGEKSFVGSFMSRTYGPDSCAQAIVLGEI